MANDHFNVFILEKNLKDNILIETLVPSNMQEVKKLDKFILQLVKEKRQKALLAQDMLYEKIQKKNVDVMGPLRKLLQFLEQAKREGENSTVVLENLPRFSPKSVLLVGQANTAVSCHRRLSVLYGVMNNSSQSNPKQNLISFRKKKKISLGKNSVIKYPRLLKHSNSPKNSLLVLCSKIHLVLTGSFGKVPRRIKKNSVEGITPRTSNKFLSINKARTTTELKKLKQRKL